MNESSEKARLQQHVTQLGDKFLRRTQADTEMLCELIERVHRGDLSVLIQMQRIAHKIHGSGALFGFPAVSEAGRETEHLIDDLISRSTGAGGAMDAHLVRLVSESGARLAREVAAAAARAGLQPKPNSP